MSSPSTSVAKTLPSSSFMEATDAWPRRHGHSFNRGDQGSLEFIPYFKAVKAKYGRMIPSGYVKIAIEHGHL